jgi:uncharacterized protein YggT (Ycf19 family)
MGFVDLLLNLAGLLLWLTWRSFRFDPLVQRVPRTLAGTLKPLRTPKLKGSGFLLSLLGLLVFRAVVYYEIGPAADWTPKLDFGLVVLALRSHFFLTASLFSVLSFLRVLVIFYFWLLILVIFDRTPAEEDSIQRMVRLHLGRIERWPWWIQLFLAASIVTGSWVLLHPVLVGTAIVPRCQNLGHLVEQGLLVSGALFLTLKYLLPVLLFLYFVTSYVYLGASPLWNFVSLRARSILTPLRSLPLRFSKVDLAPLAGVLIILLLLQVAPYAILTFLKNRHTSLWPL